MNAPFETKTRPITIAIFAMGGEGGGVLADWIIDLAEHNGYIAQLTSVPGVAQRTGATNYYLEIFRRPVNGGREPVMALIPMPGDVDVVIASELMEAGRAIQRGLVTPDRTTLIASTNRVFSMTERTAMADGRVDETALFEGCRNAAKIVLRLRHGGPRRSDRQRDQRGAVRRTRRRAGVAVRTPGLRGRDPAWRCRHPGEPCGLHGRLRSRAGRHDRSGARTGTSADARPPAESAALADAMREVERQIPQAAHKIVSTGVERVADYQDVGYARLYLQRLAPIAALENGRDGRLRLLQETARQLALGMAYEDTIRVAELKIRPSRFARVRAEVRAADGQIIEIAEFMHPRTQEIADTLPAPLGRFILGNDLVRGLLDRLTRKGKTVKTTSLRGFLLLYAVAALKPLRPKSLRYGEEQKSLEEWLETLTATAHKNYDLAIEVAAARNLVKGYGDTHERGRARFAALIKTLPQLIGRQDGAAKLAALRKAANADDSGAALAAAIAELNA